ncbi:MAG: LysR family transcriptional regulator [Candidatus Lustribacter sp.]
MFSLRDLECFMAVVEYKTFSRAARHLSIAQPPLSRRIAELERQIGAPLFLRGAREVELTPAGLALVKQARIVLEQAKLAEHIRRDTVAGSTGQIRVGYVGVTGFSIMPDAIRSFRKSHSNASIKLVYYLFAHQSDALRFGTIDVALVSGSFDAENFQADRLATNHLVVALPAHHPMARLPVVPVADLAKEPFIEFPRYGPTGLHDLVRGVCARSGFVPNIAQEAEGHEMLLACVAAGLGVALVNNAACVIPRNGVIFKEIAPESPPVHLEALSRRDDANPLVAQFIEHLKDAYAR